MLSAAGVCSRRAAERYITDGRVTVNGVLAAVGDSADWSCDIVAVDGRPISLPEKPVYFMLNKPRGVITTLSDERGRPTVIELLDGVQQRIYPVGRLDGDTEGLLLLTNDGALAQKLTHPSHQVYKQYRLTIRVTGWDPKLPPEKALAQPIVLDGRAVIPAVCRMIQKNGQKAELSISIREGRNRQIRRLCEACGYTVLALKRISVGELKLGDLPVGQYRELTRDEVSYLHSL